MTRYLPLCGGRSPEKKKVKRVVTLEEEKIIRWTINDKEDWEEEEEIKEDHRKIEKIVPRRFLKWKKMFGKIELERMLIRKTWDHAIDIKETFKL